MVIDQCQGEQPGAVQPPQVDLVPKDEGGGGDALLPQQERCLRPEGEFGARDVQHRDEGCFRSRGGLCRGRVTPGEASPKLPFVPKPAGEPHLR